MKSISNGTASENFTPALSNSPTYEKTQTKRLNNRSLNNISGFRLPTFQLSPTRNDSSTCSSTLDNSDFSLPPGGATTPPSLNPAFGSPSFSTNNASSLWVSIFNPIKKLWEIPTIHLSTYYGLPNQPGRPGPVLAVLVDRSAISSRSKQKRQHQQQRPSSVPGSTFNRVGVDLKSSFPGLTKNSLSISSSSNRSHMDFIPDVEGILVVTPLAIEKYQLNGTIVKRAALPAAIAAFICTKIAGVGKVFLCGTHKGEIHVLKADLLDSMLIFGTGCLKGKFLNRLIRSQVADGESQFLSYRNTSSYSSQFSYAQSVEPLAPSIFADPPRLFSEVAFAMHSNNSHHSLSYSKPKSLELSKSAHVSIDKTEVYEETNDISSNLEENPVMNKNENELLNVEETTDNVDKLSVLQQLGSFTGDGMTPALIEGKSKKLLTEDLDMAEMLRCFSGVKLTDNGESHSTDAAKQNNEISNLKPSALLQEKLFQIVNRDVDFMKEFSDSIRNERVGVCSLATKCSFGSFTEAILAGTEDGEVFVWAVPSGRLLYVLEHPNCCEATCVNSTNKDSIINENAYKENETSEKLRRFSFRSDKEQQTYTVLPPSQQQQQCQWQDVDEQQAQQQYMGRSLESRNLETNHKDKNTKFCVENELLPSPALSSSSSTVYVGSIKVIHFTKREYHVYVGYGDGCAAVFDFNTATCLRCWKGDPENGPATAIEISSELGCVLILSGNNKLSVWNFNSSDLVKAFSIAELTAGIPVSYMKVVDPEKRFPSGPTAILFSGCVDGSIFVHRLSWESHSTFSAGATSSSTQHQATTCYGTLMLPSSSIPTNNSILRTWSGIEVGEPVHSMESTQSRQILPAELQCVPIKNFKRECGPLCPVTSMWIDTSLDTAFIGDASGVAATLLPIRYLLEPSPSSPPSASSSPSTSNRATHSYPSSSSDRSQGKLKHSGRDAAAKQKLKSKVTGEKKLIETKPSEIIATREVN